MVKAGGEPCLNFLTAIFNDMIFKGEGDTLTPNSCRPIKLLKHAFKLYERVLDRRLCELVDINKRQQGHIPGKEMLLKLMLCLY